MRFKPPRCLLGFQNRRALLFTACCLCVAAVSVHDAILVILNDEVIVQGEQNPMGRFLLDAQGGEVGLFVLVKLAGTAVVCATLITLYQHRRRIGMIAAGALAVFQLGLLGYLTFK
jgi:hypothetical protein